MYVLFLIMITAPGAYQVHPLQTYQGVTAQSDCASERSRILKEFHAQYKNETDEETYTFVCLKQKESTVPKASPERIY